MQRIGRFTRAVWLGLVLVWARTASAGVGTGLEAIDSDPAKAAATCTEAIQAPEKAGAGWICVGMARAAGAPSPTGEKGAGPAIARVVARLMAERPPGSHESDELAKVLIVPPVQKSAQVTPEVSIAPVARRLRAGLSWVAARGEDPGLLRLRARTLVLTTLLAEATGRDAATQALISVRLVNVWQPHWKLKEGLRADAAAEAVGELGTLLRWSDAPSFQSVLLDAAPTLQGTLAPVHEAEWAAVERGPNRLSAFRKALQVAEEDGDPLCALALRQHWLALASGADRATPASLRAFADVPDLFRAVGVEPEDELDWLRMASDLAEANRPAEAYPLLQSLRGGRIWRWMHARDTRSTPLGKLAWDRLLDASFAALDLEKRQEQQNPYQRTRQVGGGWTWASARQTAAYLTARSEVARVGGPPPPMPGLDEVQDALGAVDPRAVVLSYHAGHKGFWIEVLTPARWELRYVAREGHALTVLDLLRENVREVRQAFSAISHAPRASGLLARQPAPWRELHGLYELLLKPVEDLLEGSGPVFVVAPAPFLHVPFAALLPVPPPEPWVESAWDDAPFFGVKHPVGSLPFSGWLTKRTPTASSGSAVVYAKSHFADAPALTSRARVPVLPELPGALEEADVVAAHLPGSRLVCDEGCADRPSARTFSSTAPAASVIHLATHADANVPGRYRRASAIWLEDDKGRPTRVWAHTIEALPFTADLVTASACATGSGGGDDLEQDGFALSFLLGGARSVVSTQWPVDDQTPIEMFNVFYPAWHTRTGATAKLLALQAAQADLRSHGRSHPYFWSVFSLFGSPG